MKLLLFTYRAAVLGALVLVVLLQLALLRVAEATYKLVKIEAEILLMATAPEEPRRPAPRAPADLRIAER
jgi:hypothetical protein